MRHSGEDDTDEFIQRMWKGYTEGYITRIRVRDLKVGDYFIDPTRTQDISVADLKNGRFQGIIISLEPDSQYPKDMIRISLLRPSSCRLERVAWMSADSVFTYTP